MTTDRRTMLITVATELFAQRGYRDVSVDDIGAAAGVSGPAVYRHFSSKDAILEELCGTAIEELLAGAKAAVEVADPRQTLEMLVKFHARFGAFHRRLAAVYDREHRALPPLGLQHLRRQQRDYEAIWHDTLGKLWPEVSGSEIRGVVTAVLTLLNSAAHMPAALNNDTVERLLSRLALSAIDSYA